MVNAVCEDCAAPLGERAARGRRRRFCSERCEKRHWRTKDGLLAQFTKAERNASETWQDAGEEGAWEGVIRRHDGLIRRTVSAWYATHDLPAEMSGTPNLTIAWQAVAELIHECGPHQVTKAMIVNRVKARLSDEQRSSEEFERGEVEEAHEDFAAVRVSKITGTEEWIK